MAIALDKNNLRSFQHNTSPPRAAIRTLHALPLERPHPSVCLPNHVGDERSCRSKIEGLAEDGRFVGVLPVLARTAEPRLTPAEAGRAPATPSSEDVRFSPVRGLPPKPTITQPSVRLRGGQHCAKDLSGTRASWVVSHLLAAAASSGCADQAARGAAPAKPARTATLLPLPELLPRRKPCTHPRKLRLQVHHTEKHTTEL